jgi:hypothetical protein
VSRLVSKPRIPMKGQIRRTRSQSVHRFRRKNKKVAAMLEPGVEVQCLLDELTPKTNLMCLPYPLRISILPVKLGPSLSWLVNRPK